MANIKLTYFDFSGSRGEECRLALHIAGVEFEDERIKGPDWPALQPKTPFGSMPLLTVEGKGVLAQTNAILVYVGRAHGLHPSDPWAAAQHEALMNACEDLRFRAATVLFSKLEGDERKRAREELAEDVLKPWGAKIEKLLGDGPFVAGEAIQVVDLKLYILVRWFAKGIVDHVPKDVFDGYSKLTGVYRAVADHPRVVDWMSRHA